VGDIVNVTRLVKLPRLFRAGSKNKAKLIWANQTRFVILLVAHRRQLAALGPRAHMICAVAHNIRHIKAGAVFRQIAAQRHRGDRRADALDKVRARRAQCNDKGGFILGRDLKLCLVAGFAHLVVACHHAHQRMVRRIGCRIGQALPGIDKIVRRHLLPVRPARGRAQREAVGHGAVIVRFLGIFLRHTVGEHHLAAAVVALAHQVFVQGMKNAVGVRIGVHRGIERVDRAADAHVENELFIPLFFIAAAGQQPKQQRCAKQQRCDPFYRFHSLSY